VELRYPRFVDADLGADLLHRGFLVVVEPDDLLLARGQRFDGRADAIFGFGFFVGGVGLLGLGRNERRRQRRLIEVFSAREWGGRFNRVDADDGAAEALLVRSHLGGEVGERRLASELAPQLLARRFELTPLAADAARPRVLAQRVDHGAADAAFGKGFELDPARLVETMRCVNQSNDPVLDEIADVDRVGHGRRYSASKLLDKRKAGNDAGILFDRTLARAHVCDLRTSNRQRVYQ